MELSTNSPIEIEEKNQVYSLSICPKTCFQTFDIKFSDDERLFLCLDSRTNLFQEEL